jgi:hypothetical protein
MATLISVTIVFKLSLIVLRAKLRLNSVQLHNLKGF